VSVNPPIVFFMPDSFFMKIFMHIMVPEPIPAAHFINPFHQSVCLYVFLPIVARRRLCKIISRFIARQRLCKHVPAATNRRVAGSVCLWVYLCVPLSSLGNEGTLEAFSVPSMSY
jgi:hypothetical protein